MANTTVKGPASYFPAIEKAYGKPVSHWLEVIAAMQTSKHMEMVSILKSEHQMGHGHANALVAHYRQQQDTRALIE